MEFLNTTTRYSHKTKGGVYIIMFIHKMKHPETNLWIPCVTYQSLQDNRIWTRSLDSFINNFEDNNESNSASSAIKGMFN